MSPQPFSTLKGFGVTFRQIFRKPITQQYPEFKRAVYPRFRGRHMLHRHANGLEKCVGCSLCAAACPSDCIRVVAAENTPENRVSPGERYARIYEINMLIAIASLVLNAPNRIRNSPTKFAEPGIASVASATIRNSAASTGPRNASPPIFVMSSVPVRSASSTMMRNSGATTSPWLTAWSSAP